MTTNTDPALAAYQCIKTQYGRYIVTGPGNHGPEGDGYFLGVFRTPFHASLFIRALILADDGAPIINELTHLEGFQGDAS